jgi:hypothetical protein
MTMRFVLVALGLLLSHPASAQISKIAASGSPILLLQVYSTNPDCSAAGRPVVRPTQSPEHGRMTITHTSVFPNFPQSNVRSTCNKRRVPGVVIRYVSQRGYTGTDAAAFEVYFPGGQARRASFFITVR